MKHILTQSTILYPVTRNIEEAIEYIDEVMEKTYDILKPYETINIWCRGSSGAVLAGLYADRLLKNFGDKCIYIMHVKKEGETSHSGSGYTVDVGNQISLIIDDFISTGETINQITSYIRRTSNTKPTMLIVSQINCNKEKIDCFSYIDYLICRD